MHRVVVIGAGFGGLFATKELRKAKASVTLIDRNSYHLFQPLLYQVATGILSEGEVAPPTRDILRHQRNARVLTGEVTKIDLAARTVASEAEGTATVTPYDSLIVAVGAGQSYFGHDEFARYAPGMKSIGDALQMRASIFGAFEMAELATDAEERATRQVMARLRGRPTLGPFRYFDKGMLATISRFRAVAAIGPLRLAGFPAWLLWLVVHLYYLVGFKNRVSVVLHWAVSFVGRARSERTIAALPTRTTPVPVMQPQQETVG